MTDTLPRSAGRCRGREARLLTAGVLACGAVLLPAGSALAEDMPAMKNGMMCPHAVGDASNPATAAPPTRSAPNEAPLGAKPSAVVTKPSPGRAASPPASKAPAERASAAHPASAPATVTAHTSAGAGAVATRPAVAAVVQRPAVTAPVARASAPAPRAHRSAPVRHSAPARHAQAPRAATPVIPDVTRPSAGSAPRISAAVASGHQAGVAWQAIGGAVALMTLVAVALVLRRRRRGVGTVLEPVVARPAAMTFDEVESVLRELLAQARGRDALLDAESGMDADREPVTVAG